jgi:hypothetical protein
MSSSARWRSTKLRWTGLSITWSRSPQDKPGGALRCGSDEALKVTHSPIYWNPVCLSKHSVLALHSLRFSCLPRYFQQFISDCSISWYIWDMFAWNLGEDTDYLDWRFLWFSQSLQVNARIVPVIQLPAFIQLLSNLSLPVILPCDTV